MEPSDDELSASMTDVSSSSLSGPLPPQSAALGSRRGGLRPPSTAAAAAAAQQSGGKKGETVNKHGQTCISCRLSRLKCSKTYPCTRCIHLCLKCRPQVRKRSSRRSKAATGASGGGGGGGEQDQQLALPDAKLALVAETVAASIMDAHPLQEFLVDIVFQRTNPMALAEIVCRAGTRLYREGLTSRELVLHHMRKWWIKSRLTDGDSTWGFLKTLMREMNVTQAEVEGNESLLLGPTEEMQRKRCEQDMQKVMARIPEVERSDFWRQANSDGVAMYAHVMTDDGLFVEATNAMAAHWWRGIDQLLCHDQFKHRMLSNLLMLALMAPEDRQDFSDMIMEVSLCQTKQHITKILKAFNRQGDVQLYLYEARPLSMFSDAHGFMLRVEPCPPSRHMTATPGLHTAINAFRQHHRRALPAVGAAAGAGGLGGEAELPLGEGIGPYGSAAAPAPVPPRLRGRVPPPDAHPTLTSVGRGVSTDSNSSGGSGVGKGSSSGTSSGGGAEGEKNLGVAILANGHVPLPRPLTGRRQRPQVKREEEEEQQQQQEQEQQLLTAPALPALAALPIQLPAALSVRSPQWGQIHAGGGAGGGGRASSPRAAKRQAVPATHGGAAVAAAAAAVPVGLAEIFPPVQTLPSGPPPLGPLGPLPPRPKPSPALRLPPWCPADTDPSSWVPPIGAHGAAPQFQAAYGGLGRAPVVAADAWVAGIVGNSVAIIGGQASAHDDVALPAEVGGLAPPNLDEETLEGLFD